jgi:hypothetical protein
VNSKYYSLLPAAAALHIVEEFVYPGGFLDAMKETAPRFERHVTVTFAVVINSLFFLLCVLAALFGEKKRLLSHSVLGLVFMNGLTHVAATLARRRYNPGAVTGLLIYIPLASAGFKDALSSGVADRRQVLDAFAIAAAYQATPFVTLLVKDLRDRRAGE